MTQWPDPNKPGYPVNAEKAGVHLWSDDELQNTWGLNWSPHHQQWFSRGSSMASSKDLVERGWRYLGPAIPYADAFTAGARAAREDDLRVVGMLRDIRVDVEASKSAATLQVAIDAIESLPLPEPAGSKADQIISNDDASDLTTAYLFGRSSVDLSGLEALAAEWAHPMLGAIPAATTAFAIASEKLRAEIAKLKGK